MKNMRKYWHDRQLVCVFAGGIKKKKKRFNWEQLIKEQLLLIIVQHYSSE